MELRGYIERLPERRLWAIKGLCPVTGKILKIGEATTKAIAKAILRDWKAQGL